MNDPKASDRLVAGSYWANGPNLSPVFEVLYVGERSLFIKNTATGGEASCLKNDFLNFYQEVGRPVIRFFNVFKTKYASDNVGLSMGYSRPEISKSRVSGMAYFGTIRLQLQIENQKVQAAYAKVIREE